MNLDQYGICIRVGHLCTQPIMIKNNISLGKDIIGRDHRYEKIQIRNNFPKYIIDNKNKYQDWIL